MAWRQQRADALRRRSVQDAAGVRPPSRPPRSSPSSTTKTARCGLRSGSGRHPAPAARRDRAAGWPIRNYQLKYSAFDKFDGSAGTSRWFGNRAAMRAKDGRLWFVAGRGVTVVDPQVLARRERATPEVRIEGAVVDGAPRSTATEASFPPRHRRVEIDYTVLNLTSALKTPLPLSSRRLRPGLDRCRNAPAAFYTNLPPRDYAFRVMATDADGTFTDPARSGGSRSGRCSIRPVVRWRRVAAAAVWSVGAAWRCTCCACASSSRCCWANGRGLSREIHDTLLQSLFGFALQCDASRKRCLLAPD